MFFSIIHYRKIRKIDELMSFLIWISLNTRYKVGLREFKTLLCVSLIPKLKICIFPIKKIDEIRNTGFRRF